MRRLLLIVMVVLFAGGDLLPDVAMGQGLFGRQQQDQQQPQRRHRTILDMLFGPRDNAPEQQQMQPPQQIAPPVVRKPQPAKLPPAKPTIAKAEGATRIAVFGDILAAEVGDALDRFYADDPNVAILQQAVNASGFARPDYFDWNKAIGEQIAAKSFDVAVVMVGANDRQTISVDGKSARSLTDEWKAEYTARLSQFLSQLRAANKPVVWIGLPPAAGPQLSDAMSQISALERLTAFGNGADFVDIYDKFLDDNGDYAVSGPDVNGQQAQMRRSDGIRFTRAGADKVAFYANQSIRLYAHGGAGVAVSDPLAGTDADSMLRPPYQGLGQSKLLQLAGAVVPLTGVPARAEALIEAGSTDLMAGFDSKQMLEAPVGRADAFGVGIDPAQAPSRSDAGPGRVGAALAPGTVPVAGAGVLAHAGTD